MLHLQEADLLFTPADVRSLAATSPPALPGKVGLEQRFGLEQQSMQQDVWFLHAQLEFSAEDEEVDIVPSFQVQDPVHDDMLVLAAVRFGRCFEAPGTSGWLLE